MTALERSVLRFPRATRERLDDLAATVSNLLNREEGALRHVYAGYWSDCDEVTPWSPAP